MGSAADDGREWGSAWLDQIVGDRLAEVLVAGMAALVPQRAAAPITFQGVAVAAIAAAGRVLTAISRAE